MNREQENIYGGTYTALETREVKEASQFYLIEEHKVAIPCSPTSQDTLSVFAVSVGNWNLPETLKELPTCSPSVLEIIFRSSPGWEVLPVLKKVLIVMPIEVLSPSILEAIRNAKKRNSSEGKKKYYPTGTLDLSL